MADLLSGDAGPYSQSAKSLEGFQRAWVEEGQALSARSLQILRPTIRQRRIRNCGLAGTRAGNRSGRYDVPLWRIADGREAGSGQLVGQSWFPDVLGQEREDCLRDDPDQYGHIWEGDYITVSAGAYFARQLADARASGRIGRVAALTRSCKSRHFGTLVARRRAHRTPRRSGLRSG